MWSTLLPEAEHEVPSHQLDVPQVHPTPFTLHVPTPLLHVQEMVVSPPFTSTPFPEASPFSTPARP